jgi:hypothetical protein
MAQVQERTRGAAYWNDQARFFNQATSQAVIALLKKREVSGRQLAARINWGPNMLYTRLSGRTAWTVADLHAIANVLNTEAHHILRYAQGIVNKREEAEGRG